jgi:cytochrome c oxidase subunit 2
MKRVMLLFLFVGLIAVGAFSARVGRAQDAPKRIELTAHRFAFEPAEITLKKGEPVVLVFKSMDVEHGMHLPELNLELKIPKGGTLEVPLTPAEAGDFVGHCAVYCGAGHGGMMLTIHVVE